MSARPRRALASWTIVRAVAVLSAIVISVAVTTTRGVAGQNLPLVPPTVSFPTTLLEQVEGNAGTSTVTFTASLSHAAAGDVTVNYATVDGSTTVADDDYQPVSGVLTIAAGATDGTIAVRVVGDATAEDYESFGVKLSKPVGARLGNAKQSVEILNDDTPRLSMASVKVDEGAPAVFAPRLAQRYYLPISLTATTNNATAIAPADYSAVDTSLTIPAGTKGPVDVSVATVADAITEPAETFSLTVSGNDVAPVTRTATIANEICTGAAPPTKYDHVVVVVLENKHAYDLTNNPAAPWFNGLVKSCATDTKFASTASPSRPNYIAMTAGNIFGCAGSDAGPGPKGGCVPTSESIFKEVLDSGGTVRDYAESMTTNCQLHNAGEYAVRHNPWPYFTAEAALCSTWNQPLPDPIDVTDLATLTYIVPNLCDDTHNCDIATGDAWLAQHIQPILDSAAYRSGNTALFITYDEYTYLPNAFVSRSVDPGTKVNELTSHYGLLRTIDEVLGLPPLANAATAPNLRPATHM